MSVQKYPHSIPTVAQTGSPDQEQFLDAQCLLLCGIQNRQTSTAVANIMAAMAKALPSYAWLTALPQLISRICHTNPEVNTVTNHIITHVAEAYPQQVRSPASQSASALRTSQVCPLVVTQLHSHATKTACMLCTHLHSDNCCCLQSLVATCVPAPSLRPTRLV